MKILADTHVILWALAEPEKLPTHARELLESRENVVYYSVASVWEIAIKHAINPSNMPVSEERFAELCDEVGFARLDLLVEHIFAVKTLRRSEDAPRHKDPFDRILISQAKVEGFRFLTDDSLLPAYGEPCIESCDG